MNINNIFLKLKEKNWDLREIKIQKIDKTCIFFVHFLDFSSFQQLIIWLENAGVDRSTPYNHLYQALVRHPQEVIDYEVQDGCIEAQVCLVKYCF